MKLPHTFFLLMDLASIYLPLMAAPLHYIIQNNTFWLLPQKAIFWEEQKALIVSDLHLGKTGHFRKEGIAVPQGVYKEDLHRLFHVIQHYKPEQLIIAGDMFHSRMNREVDLFIRWRNDVSHLHIQLIKGNHDILLDGYYAASGIAVSQQYLHVDKFCFVHDIGDVDAVHSPWSIVHRRKETSIVNRQSAMVNKVQGTSFMLNGKKEPEPLADNNEKTAKNLQSRDRKPETENCYYFSGHIHPAVLLKTGSRQCLRFPCYYFTQGFGVLPAFSAFSGTYAISPKKNDHVFAIVNGEVMKMGK